MHLTAVHQLSSCVVRCGQCTRMATVADLDKPAFHPTSYFCEEHRPDKEARPCTQSES